MPPAAPSSRALASSASSLKIDSVVSAPTELRLAISIDRLSISSSPSRCSTLAARSEPSAAISTAALRAPGSSSIVAGRSSPTPDCSAGTMSVSGSSAIEASPPASSCAAAERRGRDRCRRAARPGGGCSRRRRVAVPLPAPLAAATAAIAGGGLTAVSRSSSDSRIGASSSRSHTGSSIGSFSRLRSERVVKNRNRIAPRPSSTYLASLSGLLAAAAVVGLGERHLADRDRVAALGLDTGGVGDRFADRRQRGGGHRLVEQHRDVLAFDRPGRDRRVGDGLARRRARSWSFRA